MVVSHSQATCGKLVVAEPLRYKVIVVKRVINRSFDMLPSVSRSEKQKSWKLRSNFTLPISHTPVPSLNSSTVLVQLLVAYLVGPQEMEEVWEDCLEGETNIPPQ